MKPGDHPDFFRLPPPAGRSRESSIVLDREGRFWHDGALVEHARMARAFAGWIARHPDDGRYILDNGYDWTYFTVEDAPFFVVAVLGVDGDTPELELSNGSRTPLDPRLLSVGTGGALYVPVQGGFRARFTRAAQLALAPLLEAAEDGAVVVRAGGIRCQVRESSDSGAENESATVRNTKP
ncbi:MAG TPA: hypothetical protein VIM73_04115 [Polyangiaceae bacterium]